MLDYIKVAMMRNFSLTIIFLMLTGCATTVPVAPKWPEAPEDLKKSCEKLEEIPKDTKKLSDVVSTVVDNYALYHECRIKIEGWTDWYNEQKKVHESIK